MRFNIPRNKICPFCKNSFQSVQPKQKYCDELCRYHNWVNNNPIRIKEISKKSRIKHNLQRIKYNYHYYQLHKVEISRRNSIWKRKNRAKEIQRVINRRIRMKGNGGSHTLQEWEALKKKYYYRCAICNKRKKLHRDHIIPISKDGSNNISNIQPLCQPCNSHKSNHI